MAKYSIKSLNYIACGEARDFINMDLVLDYEVYDYVHLLCAEAGSRGYPDIESWRQKCMSDDISVDIGTEQGDGDYYPAEYIYRGEDVPLSREGEQTGVVLTEQQRYFNETDSSKRRYIRLYLSCCTKEMLERIDEFNRNRELMNQTYLLENTPNDKNNLTCDGAVTLRNAYDIRDVSIRRLGRHESGNEFMTGQAMLYPHGESHVRTHHDVYAPTMQQQPVGFCQSNTQTDFQEDAVIVTRQSSAMPKHFESDMEEHRGSEDRKQYFDMSITAQKPRSYTYEPVTSAEYALSNAFVPERSYDNIARQFVLDMPVDHIFSRNSITSDYDGGEIYYRRMMTTKSLYDSQYSMNMPTRQQLSCARTYCGIGTCAGQAYLKYWDDLNYNTVSAESDYLKSYQTASADSYDNSKYSGMKPYQKIEYIYPNDYSTDAKHKSNVFSIEILSTGIGSMEEEQQAVVDDPDATDTELSSAAEKLRKLNMLKRDIKAAVQDIVRNATPANTQLFDVYFNDN